VSQAEQDLEQLLGFAKAIEAYEEGGQEYILLRDATLPAGCNPPRADLLLRTTAAGDGYGSKLFFPPHVKGTLSTRFGAGWQETVSIIGRTWTWYSWKVPAEPSMWISQRLLAHLRPLGA
jgi:hypothetical protein